MQALLQTDVGRSGRYRHDGAGPSSSATELDLCLRLCGSSDALADACVTGNAEMAQLLLDEFAFVDTSSCYTCGEAFQNP